MLATLHSSINPIGHPGMVKGYFVTETFPRDYSSVFRERAWATLDGSGSLVWTGLLKKL